MKRIRVVQWGLGAMGAGMAKLMAEKEGLQIVGAIAKRKEKVGKDLGEVLGLGKKLGVNVTDNPKSILKKGEVDVVVHAVASTTKESFEELKLIMEAGINVVTIAEEMAMPEANEPELAKKIDELAKQHRVAIVGTGINPGFILDAQIVMLSAVCHRVDRIEAARINDLSPYGPTVMKSQGVGTTPEQFEKGVKSGEIQGHFGFPESIKMVAEAIGLKYDRIEQIRKPIVSKVARETPHVKVQPGMVAGCEHIGIAYCGDKQVIKLVHPQQIHPHLEGIETGDYINIFGVPEVHMSNKPEIPGGVATISLAVNVIPLIVNATPGLKRMVDLPIPSALMGPTAYERRK
ncbi:MAG: dihydrodipicolinate reductase [Candidatus Riflebacteria bacterium]|nr:dihydrodipicolinate reductase [Candidatus Riflebacteria bacterium]